MAASVASVALTAAGSLTLVPASAAMIADNHVSVATPAPSGSAEPIDIAGLQAQREAQLQRRSIAVEVRIGNLAAIEAERIAALGYDPKTATTPREIARQMMANKFGWGEDQFACYDSIIMRESRWNPFADNPHSSAYGIPQALPGSKMASAGADWQTNPATQITWGLGYVKQRYGTPCGAWGFKRSHGWY
ncbi:MAG: lytic transglycosylase domain-containing protein [Propionicimonas sp.]